MWSIRDIKIKGRSALKKNYWRSVVVAALMFLLATVASKLSQIRSRSILQNVGFEPLHRMAPNEIMIITGIVVVGYMSIIVFAVLLKIICFNALEAGGCLFFRNNVEEGPAKLSLIREGFSDYAHVFTQDDGREQMARIPVGPYFFGMAFRRNHLIWNYRCSVDASLL